VPLVELLGPVVRRPLRAHAVADVVDGHVLLVGEGPGLLAEARVQEVEELVDAVRADALPPGIVRCAREKMKLGGGGETRERGRSRRAPRQLTGLVRGARGDGRARPGGGRVPCSGRRVARGATRENTRGQQGGRTRTCARAPSRRASPERGRTRPVRCPREAVERLPADTPAGRGPNGGGRTDEGDLHRGRSVRREWERASCFCAPESGRRPGGWTAAPRALSSLRVRRRASRDGGRDGGWAGTRVRWSCEFNRGADGKEPTPLSLPSQPRLPAEHLRRGVPPLLDEERVLADVKGRVAEGAHHDRLARGGLAPQDL
jgi:hypothetical protein